TEVSSGTAHFPQRLVTAERGAPAGVHSMADRRSRRFGPTAAISVAAIVVLAIARTAASQESINAARDLYTAAAYEDALALLDRLRASAHRADDSRYIEQYRAFCLLALGRTTDAERAIEAVVTA